MVRYSLYIFILFQISLLEVFAGAKDDFIQEVVSQCGKTEAEAKKYVTPGRTGSVVGYKLCKEQEFKVKDCTLKCKSRSGNVIGN